MPDKSDPVGARRLRKSLENHIRMRTTDPSFSLDREEEDMLRRSLERAMEQGRRDADARTQ